MFDKDLFFIKNHGFCLENERFKKLQLQLTLVRFTIFPWNFAYMLYVAMP